MLSVANKAEISIVLRLKADAVCRGKALECRARPCFPQVTRDRCGELLDGHRRTPKPEAGCNWRQIGRNERVGLQPLDRRWLPLQGETDIAGDIEEETPDHAMNQRRHVESKEMLRPQHAQAPRAVGQDALADDPDV